MLPHWQQAFAMAQVATRVQQPPAADVIWLRLRHDLTAAEQIRQLQPGNALLVVLSDTPNDEEGMQAFFAGARGYCNSHANSATLQQVATVIGQGGLWVGVALMARILGGVDRLPAPAPAENPQWRSQLTNRELQVARLIASGASNKEVARALAITERTVKAHVSGLFVKLQVQDRLQLALKMRALGT